MWARQRGQLQLPEALGLDDAKVQTSCRYRPGAALPSHETQWPMDRLRTGDNMPDRHTNPSPL